MSADNKQPQGLWPSEDELVQLAPTSMTVAVTNGDLAARQPSAAEFTAERMLRPTTEAPARGWRRSLYVLSGGLIRVGPSSAELRRRELVAAIKTPITGCRKVAFISRKGGVGKTTTCLLAGHTFAAFRGDRIVAVDGNPDAGTLGHRVRRETTANLTSLLADADRIERYADIRGYTSQAPTRLEVVASDDDPRITQAIGEAEFERAIHLLEHHYNLVCLDTGTGVLESVTRGILKAADQIVVVSAPSLDGARAASSTLDWLDENGHEDLVRGAVAVLNAVRPTQNFVDLKRIESHFSRRCRASLCIPWDPHLEAGAEASIDDLRRDTQAAFLELAASVAAGFTAQREGRK
jgi:putative peptide zinc metalloprotease protein